MDLHRHGESVLEVNRVGAVAASAHGPRHLFVYGTLGPGFQNPYARLLNARAQRVAPAWVYGRLYNLGFYPGLAAEERERGKVFGHLYKTPDAQGLFHHLDRYEGCDEGTPEPHLFRRVRTVAHLAGAVKIPAWAYHYMGETDGRPRILSGRLNPCR